jgi:hypothetical protein
VTDGANIDMWLGSFKLFFRHSVLPINLATTKSTTKKNNLATEITENTENTELLLTKQRTFSVFSVTSVAKAVAL